MPHDAQSFYETWPQTMNAMKARSPEIGRAFGAFFKDLMKDGALPTKSKELIAVSIGVAMRCESCIYAHVEKCLKVGATSGEIMEAAGVALMMGGGPVYTYLPVVDAALRHFEGSAADATTIHPA